MTIGKNKISRSAAYINDNTNAESSLSLHHAYTYERFESAKQIWRKSNDSIFNANFELAPKTITYYTNILWNLKNNSRQYNRPNTKPSRKDLSFCI